MIDGLWIFEIYYPYLDYPIEAYGYLLLGIGLTVISFLITQYKRKRTAKNKEFHHFRNEKDNRVVINKIWANKTKIADKVVGTLLVTLVIIAIINFEMLVILLIPIMCLGMIICGFIFIMHDDEKDEVEAPQKNKIMRLIDYRTHPFSLPLILFILVVVSFLLSNQLGYELDLDTGGNSMYVSTLPVAMYLEAVLIFTCGFMYIIQNGDFLGVHLKKQSDDKLLMIHCAVGIASGSTFLIWLMILLVAIFRSIMQ